MKVITDNPIIRAGTLTQFMKNQMLGEGMGEYETAGPDSYGTQFGIDGDAQFKKEMAEGEGEGEYWTAGGGSYLDADGVSDGGEVRDNYNAKQVSAGGMTIKTENPVYEDTQFQADEWLSSVSGATRRARRARKKRTRGRSGGGGGFMDKLKGGFNKLKQSGIFDAVKGAVGGAVDEGNQAGGNYASPEVFTPTPLPPEKKDEGMSTTAKVGIAVGVVVLVSVGAYFLTRGGKGTKK